MSKISGTVKWFSNRKGFGFIIPSSENSPTEEAIFVHQTSIFSDGDYRTLVRDPLRNPSGFVTDICISVAATVFDFFHSRIP